MIGQIISQYKIIEKLGEGGMGVVYKAIDTKLNREVALKFLPSHIAKGGVERDRFLQEAQAAAAINHPNICVIYEINDSEEQPYIAMEYVDGSTIRTKLESGPMRTDDAIKYGIQIGEALQEAHSKGIVHRDIKADNIIINSKGQAKVMDFGLAKLKGSMKLTKTSSTVGTLGYMAPEQIQGGEVDTRSDIFAFAVLFFEMLTARLPFRGEHEAAMVYSIVNEDPEPIQNILPEISPEIAHTLSKALEKDPESRYQNIQDMVVDLRRSKKDSTRVSRITQSVHRIDSSAQRSETQAIISSRIDLKKMMTFAVPVIFLLALILWFLKPGVQLNPEMSFRVLQIPYTNIRYPGLTSDGNWAAFPVIDENNRWDLYFMNTGRGEPRRITSDSNLFLSVLDISPDGSQIVYCGAPQGNTTLDLFIVSVLGGTPRLLSKNVVYASWYSSGERILFLPNTFIDNNSVSRSREVWSIKPDGSDERIEFKDTISTIGNRSRISLDCSPDSRSFVYLRTFSDGYYQEVITVDLQTKEERQITNDKKNIDEVCWAPNGQIIFSSNRGGNTNLWMVSETGGEPVQITKGAGPDLGIKISNDGKKLLYYQNQTISDLWIGNLVNGSARRITNDELPKSDPEISPDNSSIVFIMTDPDPLFVKQSLSISHRDGSNRRVLYSGKEPLTNTLWSPDGRWIAFTEGIINAPSDSALKTYVLEASRPGKPTFVSFGNLLYWQDNSSVLVFHKQKSKIVNVNSNDERIIGRDSTGAILFGKNFLFYRDNSSANSGRYIVKIDNEFNPVGTPRKLMESYPMSFKPWNPFLFYSDKVGKLNKISLPDGKTQSIPGFYPGLVSNFSVSDDGKLVVYAEQNVRGKLVMIENPFK